MHNIDFLANFIHRIDKLNVNIDELSKNNNDLLKHIEKLEYKIIPELVDNYKKIVKSKSDKKNIV